MPVRWTFGDGWQPYFDAGNGAIQALPFGQEAWFRGEPLLDMALQARVMLENGVAALTLRQNEFGGYTVAFEESGFLRLYRTEQEVGQVFLGPITGQWRTLRLSAAGDVVRVSLDGAILITFVDPAPLPAGLAVLGGARSVGSQYWLDDLGLWAAEDQAPEAAFMAPQAAFMAPEALTESLAGRISSRLAYSYCDDAGCGLEIVRPDGTVQHVPGYVKGTNSEIWSPDWQWITFLNRTDQSLHALSPETGAAYSLTGRPAAGRPAQATYEDHCPSWSQDGSRIAFISSGRDGSYSINWQTYLRSAIYVVPTDGVAAPVRLLIGPDDGRSAYSCPKWSPAPGSAQLATIGRNAAGERTIYLVNADSGLLTPLVSMPVLQTTVWSPDGRYLAFVGGATLNQQGIYVIDWTTGATRQITSDPNFNIWGPAWSPDGSELAFEYYSSGATSGIAVVGWTDPCPGCTLRILNGSSYHDQEATWSPDGRWIAVHSRRDLPENAPGNWNYYHEIYLIATDQSGAVRVTNDAQYNFAPAWSPFIECPSSDAAGFMAFSAGGEYCLPVTPTPEPTPTPIPRDVAPEAEAFHALADVFGLPQPFDTYPYDPARFARPLNVQTHGATTYAGLNWEDNYRRTFGTHPGIDFGIKFSCTSGEPSQNRPDNASWCEEPVVSLCDGIVVAGRAYDDAGINHGGSSSQGYGISIRCFANQLTTSTLNAARGNFGIYDVDGDGRPNLSNIVITYNHLLESPNLVNAQSSVPNLDYLGNLRYWSNMRIPEGTVVRKGDVVGFTGDHPTYDHLHLEVYLAHMYLDGSAAVRVNPLLMMSRAMIEQMGAEQILDVYWPETVPSNSQKYIDYGIDMSDGLGEFSEGGHNAGAAASGNFWNNQDNRTVGVEWPSMLLPLTSSSRWTSPSGEWVPYLLSQSPYNTGLPYPYPNCDVPAEHSAHLVLTCERTDLWQEVR